MVSDSPTNAPQGAFVESKSSNGWVIDLKLSLEIQQAEFEAAKIGVIVIIETENYIERVSGEKLGLLEAFGHTPAQGIKNNRIAPTTSRVAGLDFFARDSNFASVEKDGIRMAAGRSQDGDLRWVELLNRNC